MAVIQAVHPVSIIRFTILADVNSVAVELVVCPRASEAIARKCLEATMSRPQIPAKFTFKTRTIGGRVAAPAVHLPLAELSLVHSAA
jgi:hypothetical protein